MSGVVIPGLLCSLCHFVLLLAQLSLNATPDDGSCSSTSDGIICLGPVICSPSSNPSLASIPSSTFPSTSRSTPPAIPKHSSPREYPKQSPKPPALSRAVSRALSDSFSNESPTPKPRTIIGAVVSLSIGFLFMVMVLSCLCKILQAEPDIEAPLQNVQMIAHQKAAGDPVQTLVQTMGNVQTVRFFSYDEVKVKITNDFEQRIGEGAFGPVYKGRLANGKQVAVKVNSKASEQGPIEFDMEVSILSRIHHRNLVRLLGVCDESDERILVYELVEGNTLRSHIEPFGRGRNKAPNLDWPTRLQIAIDTARGLDYLHNDCDPKVIHRDVKSNNIMLDEHMQAKLIDFGLSKLYKDSTRNSIESESEVKGTNGYRDPEYEATGRLTFKSDVYAFGVVLMEIISGKPPLNVIYGPYDVLYKTLVGLFRFIMSENRLEEVVDERLAKNYDKRAMQKVAILAMRCVNQGSKDRPNMRLVLKELVEVKGYSGMWTESGFQPDPASSSSSA